MRKIVINKSYEQFCVSHKAFLRLRELGQQEALQEADLIPRDDAKLVRVVEELRTDANGHCAELKVVTIPDEVQWEIAKSDGVEHVSELHRTWS
jgi:hypothetical protein